MSAADVFGNIKRALTFSTAATQQAESALTVVVADEEAQPLDPYAALTRTLDELVAYHSSPMARPTATAENIILFTSSVAQLGNEIAATVSATAPEEETYFTMAAKIVPALANGGAQLKGFYTRSSRIQAIQEAIVRHTPMSLIKEISYLSSNKEIITLPKPATQQGILDALSAKGNLYFYIEGLEEPLILIDYSVFTLKNGIMAWLAAIPLIVTLFTSLFKILQPESSSILDNPAARVTGIVASTVPILTSLEQARNYAYKQEVNVLKGYKTTMEEVYLKPRKLHKVKEDFVWPLERFLSPASMLAIRKSLEVSRDEEASIGVAPQRPQFA